MSEHDTATDDSEANRASEPSGSEVKSEAAAISSVLMTLAALSDTSREKVLRSVAAFFGLGVAQSQIAQPAAYRQMAETAPRTSNSTSTFSEDRTMSPKEFMLQKKPIQDIERVTCLAYYLTHYRDAPHFKTLDLSKLNTEAAQIKFGNAAQAVDNATKAGLIVPAAKGMKQISAKGELYVQALPDRAAAKEAVAHFRQRRKVRRARGASPIGPNGNAADEEAELSDE